MENLANTKDVLFYVLNSSDPKSLEQFLIKLLIRTQKDKRKVDVRFGDLNQATRFDQVLWNFQAESYLPHGLNNQIAAPIQLFGSEIKQASNDVLINLNPEFFAGFSNYQRTIEVLDQSQELIEKGRQRWREYKQAGFEPTVHKV